MTIRALHLSEWELVSRLIFDSTNTWYRANLQRTCFPGGDPLICGIFPEVYEALDPGCALVAEIDGRLAGSCFYHPRKTHVSLGIMNAAAEFQGHGVAKALLAEVIRRAAGKPVRLVSSALNLDSYSLYHRAGFRPLAVYQDLVFPEAPRLPEFPANVRPAVVEDIPGMIRLEDEISGICRKQDWEYFLRDSSGMWQGFVVGPRDDPEGFLFSVNHPGSCLLGPGVMKSQKAARDLIMAQLHHLAPRLPLVLVPAEENELIQTLYQLGARNCELHLSQVLGSAQKPRGIVIPTFMPESG